MWGLSGSAAGVDTLNNAAIAVPCSTTDRTKFRGDGPEYTYTILRCWSKNVKLPPCVRKPLKPALRLRSPEASARHQGTDCPPCARIHTAAAQILQSEQR